MKSFTVGVIASFAALAATQSDGTDGPECVIPCFTKTVTDYPPLECKEANMFLCFCKDPFGPDLQRHFVECLRSDCKDETEVRAAMDYGKSACAALGGSVTITDFDEPKTSAAEQPSTSAAAETTSEAPAPESTSKAEQPSSQQSEAPSTPAGSSTAASTVSDPHHVTVTRSVGATTTVCDEESSKHTVITVTSAHWECPHGCNGTVSSMTKVPKPQSSEPAQNPPCNGECHHTDKVPSSPSDKAHPTPSQGGAKPTGSDVVVPTKSAGTPASSAPVESPSTVVVNAGNSVAVSGLLAAAGVALAVFRL